MNIADPPVDPAVVNQRREALALANHKRIVVARFKGELRALPREDAAEHLATLLERRTPHNLDHAVVYGLLTAVPFIGATKAAKVLRDADTYGPDRRIRELTPRQRKLIAARLRLWWA